MAIRLDERTIRKLLIVGVGSSAGIHLLRQVVYKAPEIMFNNELFLVETSKDVFELTVHNLYRIYKSVYEKLDKDQKTEYPLPHQFKDKLLTTHNALLHTKGGATQPERGLNYFREKKAEVLNKIDRIMMENNLTGVVIIGNAGKGTGTLVTPELVNSLRDMYEVVFGFLSLPLRLNRTEKFNAAKALVYIKDNRIPVFLLDYERAKEIYEYQHGLKTTKVRLGEIYREVIEPLSLALSIVIKTLNYAEYCTSPIDWSDFRTLFEIEGVGTLAYVNTNNEETFLKKWKRDIEHQIFLKTKSVPREASVITILQSSTDVPYELAEDISMYFAKRYNAREMNSLYTLMYGQGYNMVSFISGFSVDAIEPSIIEKGWLSKLRGY